MEYGFLAGGFFLLILGSEAAVRGGVAVARGLGISPLLIGLFVISAATSAPELAISMQAGLAGAPDIAIGNVIGSNILNILLILGLGALIRPMSSPPKVVLRDGGTMLVASAALTFIAWGHMVSRGEGLFLLVLFVLYVVTTLITDWRRPPEHSVACARAVERMGGGETSGPVGVFILIFGLVCILLGTHFAVAAAVRTLNAPERVAGAHRTYDRRVLHIGTGTAADDDCSRARPDRACDWPPDRRQHLQHFGGDWSHGYDQADPDFGNARGRRCSGDDGGECGPASDAGHPLATLARARCAAASLICWLCCLSCVAAGACSARHSGRWLNGTAMDEFVLSERLAADTIVVGDLTLSRVLLMNDARFAWLILVPRRPNVTELFALSKEDRFTLMEEIASCSEKLKAYSGASKINVGALGNLVPQLHVHVVARRPDDAAWPGPVWGVPGARPYEPAERDGTLADIRAALSIS